MFPGLHWFLCGFFFINYLPLFLSFAISLPGISSTILSFLICAFCFFFLVGLVTHVLNLSIISHFHEMFSGLHWFLCGFFFINYLPLFLSFIISLTEFSSTFCIIISTPLFQVFLELLLFYSTLLALCLFYLYLFLIFFKFLIKFSIDLATSVFLTYLSFIFTRYSHSINVSSAHFSVNFLFNFTSSLIEFYFQTTFLSSLILALFFFSLVVLATCILLICLSFLIFTSYPIFFVFILLRYLRLSAV